MELRFDFADDDKKTGFRLSSFELYNWGTFDKSIVRLDMDRNNALLTGDIGSGKSTIVDALTTLLVPHQKITYNKAAGASGKERSTRSYILGEYKSSKDDNYSSSKAIALRDERNYTVLLARFENIGFDESVTLAQFFTIVNGKENKFFILSKSALSIRDDFMKFKDIRTLKKRLRSVAHTEVFESFKEYSNSFRRQMGIKNEQALNLFYQTVSLKEIGNLTSFIRAHMLEKSDVNEKIDELCQNFSDLNHAHNSVLRAKRQIELLKPIDVEGRRYKKERLRKEELEDIRHALEGYFAKIESALLEKHIESLHIDLIKRESAKSKLDIEGGDLRSKDRELNLELERNGGFRLNTIEREIEQLSQEVERAKRRHNSYSALCKKLEIPSASNEHRFLKNREASAKKIENIEVEAQINLNRIIEMSSTKKRYEIKATELKNEITYLQNNRSNIPQHISKIRDDMVKILDLEISDLPFVGELIEVKDAQWEGAIERVLNSFALSLLVEDGYYAEVVEYVEKTNLKGKLVYLKVDKKMKVRSEFDVASNSLLKKIEIKSDTPLYSVVENLLHERFNIPCVEQMSDFRRFKKALSIHGQFKSNFMRHEKDDRFDINNRSRWVLGWDSLAKLRQFESDLAKKNEKISFIDEKLLKYHQDSALSTHERDTLKELLSYGTFSEIDFYFLSKKIDALFTEKEELTQSSDIIKSLQATIEKIQEALILHREKMDELSREIGKIDANIENRNLELQSAQKVLDSVQLSQDTIAKIDKLYEDEIGVDANLNTFKTHKKTLNEKTYAQIKSLSEMITRMSNKIIGAMGDFIVEFPTLSKEMDKSLSSIDEFGLKLQELKKDDLPKWEKRFKALFKEKTIQNIVMLQQSLEQQEREIKEKIESINESLHGIEYNEGTYISLLADKSIDKEIREFKISLKSAMSKSINDDNSYDEQKFLEVKGIIDRFNGREGYVDVDKKWRKNVSDVRNWFNFSALEKYLSDGSEKEYYAHSGGKSGGQKEKLAYTVLASSLAFQFGIEFDKVQSRSFRFVMIDEAFGRGSDESTKYALRLFEKLKLQLLVITPKQKINVIEPFVRSVHFVHNEDGMKSSLLSMKIEEYQEKKVKV